MEGCNTKNKDINRRILQVIVAIISFAFLPQILFSMPPRSPAAVEFGFDLMETFDDIKDWQGAARNSKGPTALTSDDYPKRIDGGVTPFNAYDYWVSSDPGDDFIKDHRVNDGYIWDPLNTGTGKSLCLDLSHRGRNGLGNGKNWGPSRFGVYFGEGSRVKGYTTVYLFFMFRNSINQYPTDTDSATNIGAYIPGRPLEYHSSWKFITMGHGFIRPWLHGDGPFSGHVPQYYGAKSSYGWHPNIVYLNTHNNRPEFTFDIKDYHELKNSVYPTPSPCVNEYTGTFSSYTNMEIPRGKWIGVEVMYKLNDGIHNDEMEIRYYDPGKYDPKKPDPTKYEYVVARKTGLYLRASCLKDDKINFLYIGGNNSNQWLWGPTMEPRYYVDDFIINKSKIGPDYFRQKLTVPPATVPGVPLNVIIQK
jgi:hypothetical protein